MNDLWVKKLSKTSRMPGGDLLPHILGNTRYIETLEPAFDSASQEASDSLWETKTRRRARIRVPSIKLQVRTMGYMKSLRHYVAKAKNRGYMLHVMHICY